MAPDKDQPATHPRDDFSAEERAPERDAPGAPETLFRGGLPRLSVDQVVVRQGAVGRVDAEEVDVMQGAIGATRTEQATLIASSAGAIAAGGDVGIDQGAAGAVFARGNVTLDESASIIAAGGSVRARNARTVLLLGGRVEGDVRSVFGARESLIVGAAAGTVLGLFWMLFGRRR